MFWQKNIVTSIRKASITEVNKENIMIRPVSMARPSFKGYTILGGENKPEKNDNVDKPKNSYTRGLTKGEKNIFMAGAFAGLLFGMGGMGLYNRQQTKNLLEDLKMELDMSQDQKLKMKDLTEDNIPEVILEDTNGNSVFYDFMNKDIYIKMGDDVEEKL